MTASREAEIKRTALRLLELQNPRGRFALISLDYAALVSEEPVICCDISEISAPGDGVLGVSALRGGIGIIYVDVEGARRLEPEAVKTVMHEYGHILLHHAGRKTDRREAEREADAFALEFLVPEFFVRYLALTRGNLTESWLSGFLAATPEMIRKRLRQLSERKYMPTRLELGLMRRFFAPDREK